MEPIQLELQLWAYTIFVASTRPKDAPHDKELATLEQELLRACRKGAFGDDLLERYSLIRLLRAYSQKVACALLEKQRAE